MAIALAWLTFGSQLSELDELAGLGLAPKSHLLPESDIVRSKSGAEMNGKVLR